ncbi:MAG: nuclear transport factor 2 family protein [Pseudomonadota bacterium]
MQDDLAARIAVLEDIEQIRKLKARYCQACDDDHNPAKLGPLFAPDAVWEASSMGRAEGREQIQKLLGDLGASGTIRNSAHNAINPIIEVDGDQATGHWRLIMLYTGIYPDGTLHYSRIIGWYNETYVRLDHQWHFQSLFCQVEEAAPYQLAEPPETNT